MTVLSKCFKQNVPHIKKTENQTPPLFKFEFDTVKVYTEERRKVNKTQEKKRIMIEFRWRSRVTEY